MTGVWLYGRWASEVQLEFNERPNDAVLTRMAMKASWTWCDREPEASWELLGWLLLVSFQDGPVLRKLPVPGKITPRGLRLVGRPGVYKTPLALAVPRSWSLRSSTGGRSTLYFDAEGGDAEDPETARYSIQLSLHPSEETFATVKSLSHELSPDAVSISFDRRSNFESFLEKRAKADEHN